MNKKISIFIDDTLVKGIITKHTSSEMEVEIVCPFKKIYLGVKFTATEKHFKGITKTYYNNIAKDLLKKLYYLKVNG